MKDAEFWIVVALLLWIIFDVREIRKRLDK